MPRFTLKTAFSGFYSISTGVVLTHILSDSYVVP
jgi:hypothetical protein